MRLLSLGFRERRINIVIKKSFQFYKLQSTRKRESMERLLAKLRSKKETFNNMTKETLGKKDLEELKEDLVIITLLIKKGEHILEKLSV